MHVVLVSTGVVSIPPQSGGAVESYVWDLAQMLNDSGVRVSVVSNHHPNLISGALRGIEFVSTPSPIDRFPLRPETSALAHLVGGFAASVATRVYLRRSRADPEETPPILHLNEEVSGFALARLTSGLPKVLTIHNPPVALTPSDIGRSERVFRGAGSLLTLRFTLPYVDRIIALSTSMARFLESDWNTDPRKIEVLPLPIDTRFFTPPTAAATQRRGLLFVGRLEGRKNPSALLGCLAKCPEDVTLTIVGKGPLESQIRAEARARGIEHRVRILSELSVSELVHLYQTAMGLVLPSRLEVYPRVVIEAASCGLPAILPASDIYQDFVSAGFVTTHVSGNSMSLLEAMHLLLEGGPRWEEMSRAGREFAVSRLGYEPYVRKLIEIYRGVGR